MQVKIEEGAESAKATPAERNGQLAVGAEVVFKHNKNKQGVEGEGIQCIIKGITGEGNKKRWVRSIHLHFYARLTDAYLVKIRRAGPGTQRERRTRGCL
jgi:hypothetical protein